MTRTADGRLWRMAVQSWKFVLLAALSALVALFALGLGRDASFMPSALVGRMVPDFSLAALDGNRTITRADVLGTPHVINFWASWCGACREEHEVLIKLGKRYADADSVRLLGVNYRDTRANAERFLSQLGHFPYASVADPLARTGMDFGVFGLPETFFVDARGIVRARHIGPLDENSAAKYLALIGGDP